MSLKTTPKKTASGAAWQVTQDDTVFTVRRLAAEVVPLGSHGRQITIATAPDGRSLAVVKRWRSAPHFLYQSGVGKEAQTIPIPGRFNRETIRRMSEVLGKVSGWQFLAELWTPDTTLLVEPEMD